MIDPRLAWFAAGATCSAVLFGWPWHPRFSRYSRRGSNPPAPDRKPPPPAGPPIYGWGPHQLNPPPPAPGTRRIYFDMPAITAECGGPCWESLDPKACVCGQLWRDVPIRMDEGSTQRGNGKGGPTTPKPKIIAKPQLPGGLLILESALPRWRPDGPPSAPAGARPLSPETCHDPNADPDPGRGV